VIRKTEVRLKGNTITVAFPCRRFGDGIHKE